MLAEVNGSPVWATRVQEGVRHDVNLQVLPWITNDGRLFAHLKGRCFMRLIPLMDWLRSISPWRHWQKPPTRACFMFDDPNLHGQRYGSISFPQLAFAGRRYRYHTSFATVPLDHYFVNRSAARLFRENPGELSLLVHGNEHAHRELAGTNSAAHSLAQMFQALSRIRRLEQRSGVPVAKVMAPPHGAFGTTMMSACANAGFEAACVSWGSVWSSNRHEEWTRSLGADSVAVVEGLPVISRFRIARDIEDHILLAAFLRQPIIPVGHHWDLANGIELLAELAGFINGLGDIRWQDMATIARGNFWWREEADTLHVRTFSRHFEIHVPTGIRHVQLSAPWQLNGDVVTLERTDAMGKVLHGEKVSHGVWSISVEGPSLVTVKMKACFAEAGMQLLSTPLRAIAQRLLAEARDRTTPLLLRWLQGR